MQKRSKVLTRTALATALICVFSLVTIPTPFGVPITLQTFIIAYVAIVLGGKQGSIATLLYLLIGVLGLPVFSGFRGGAAVLFGPTGGFLIAFPVFALILGKGAEKGSMASIVTHLAIGMLFYNICGVIVFSIVTKADIKAAIIASVLPFILIDAGKFVAAIFLGRQSKKRLLTL